ncbi:MAG: DUF448 domain-containing protein [Deltaproteobacteria bacterium]|nr:DUF448 domain-containing protein [Deltaproteobacteria bacterium]
MAKEAPQRSCIACRETRNKDELIRFVLSPDGILVPDLMHKLPGRGAYTCASYSCILRACERKQFSRAFRKDGEAVAPEALRERIIRTMEDRIASYLALANKAGKVVSGSDQVADFLRKKSPTKRIVFLAADISEDIGQRVRTLAELNHVGHVTLFDKERYGELLGKGLRSVVAVRGDGFVETLTMEIERYRNFLRGEGCTI